MNALIVRCAISRAVAFILTLIVTSLLAEQQLYAQAIYTRFGDPAKNEAMRRIESAQIQLRRMQNSDFPLTMRRKEAEIKILKSEIASSERRLNEVHHFNRYLSIGQPLFHEEEMLRQQLERQRIQLDVMEEERSYMLRNQDDERRLRELEIDRLWDQFPRSR